MKRSPRKIVWQPTDDYVMSSNLRRFMDSWGIGDYETLIQESETNVEGFWDAFIKFADIRFFSPYTKVLDLSSGGLAWPKWFIGGKINAAHTFLEKWAAEEATAHRIALKWQGEDADRREYTFQELNIEASRFAHSLKRLGIKRGERVGIYMPMIPETVVALYGIYKAGGVAVPIFSGFGPEAISFRLNDVQAKAVVTADGFYRNGKKVFLHETCKMALRSAPSVEAVLVVERFGGVVSPMPSKDHRWSEMRAESPDSFDAIPMDSEDACIISYTSGTTGQPKGVIQVHGGLSVKSAQLGMLIFDVQPEDTFFMVTDFGWVMGQLPLLGAHAVGGALMMYEGGIMHPNAGRLFEIIEKERVSIFGAPATGLRMLKGYGDEHRQRSNLDWLRILIHTGEPIDEETWMWFFSWGNGKVPIINVSGGTELFGEIISSTVMNALKPTCLGVTPAVGAKVVDEKGKEVGDSLPGNLVFTIPQPAQTRGFWRDPQRYVRTYFPLGKHIWWHGDMVMRDKDGMWFHLGRSDDVLTIAGRRTGPGELEDILNQHEDVAEAAVIGIPDATKGEEIIALVVPVPGRRIIDDRLKEHVVRLMGKPFRPGVIHTISEMPKTRAQKIPRRIMREKYLGRQSSETWNLANPGALEGIPTGYQDNS